MYRTHECPLKEDSGSRGGKETRGDAGETESQECSIESGSAEVTAGRDSRETQTLSPTEYWVAFPRLTGVGSLHVDPSVQ